MYGVPADLPLDSLLDAALIQVTLGEHQIIFSFSADRQISIEGKWEFRDPAWQIVDQKTENYLREAYYIHKILGKTVSSYEIHPPDFFSLSFNNGYILIIFDDSKEFESFSIQPGGIIV